MPSIHAQRWIENLKDTSYELYWFDVLGKGRLERIDFIFQLTDWKKRKFPYMKGEYSLSKYIPNLYTSLRPFLEITENEALEKIIREINPDIIQSFEMQNCSYPIVQTMNKFPNIKWIYSCWGSDLFYYKDFLEHKHKINEVLNRVNYLHTDCMRDLYIAISLGFKGEHLGVIPGGTGYKINELEVYKKSIKQRKIILVKGYQHRFGRALNVVKAIVQLNIALKEYEVVIFGAHPIVQNYVEDNNLDYKVYGRQDLSHQELMTLMGKSLIYIGNNISDGMPNTLLEAMIMGAFPIQSNPGGATAEIINHGKNGLLISDPENVNEIKSLILEAIDSKEIIKDAFMVNAKLAKEKLDYESNNKMIIDIYKRLNKKK